jgi:hypothetical protein
VPKHDVARGSYKCKMLEPSVDAFLFRIYLDFESTKLDRHSLGSLSANVLRRCFSSLVCRRPQISNCPWSIVYPTHRVNTSSDPHAISGDRYVCTPVVEPPSRRILRGGSGLLDLKAFGTRAVIIGPWTVTQCCTSFLKRPTLCTFVRLAG